MNVIKYRVVTKIGTIFEYSGGLEPNLYYATTYLVNGFLVADAFGLEFDPELVVDKEPVIMKLLRWDNVKAPVFKLGEILIVNQEGIEYGLDRKTWKFNVEYKEFESIDEALACQKEVLGYMSPKEYNQFLSGQEL